MIAGLFPIGTDISKGPVPPDNSEWSIWLSCKFVVIIANRWMIWFSLSTIYWWSLFPKYDFWPFFPSSIFRSSCYSFIISLFIRFSTTRIRKEKYRICIIPRLIVKVCSSICLWSSFHIAFSLLFWSISPGIFKL